MPSESATGLNENIKPWKTQNIVEMLSSVSHDECMIERFPLYHQKKSSTVNLKLITKQNKNKMLSVT